jgi:hypothetical protein
MDITRSTEQLAADLKAAQDGLRNIRTILLALNSRTPTEGLDGSLWFEIGRAQGTATHALIVSGDKR